MALKIGDYVQLLKQYENHYRYGLIVSEYDDGFYEVEILEEDDYVSLHENELLLIPKVCLDDSFLQKLIRYELTYDDYCSIVVPDFNYENRDSYQYTLEDMRVLLQNLALKQPSQEAYLQWLKLISGEQFEISSHQPLIYAYEKGTFQEKTKLGYFLPEDDDAMAYFLFSTIRNQNRIDGLYIEKMLEDIESFIHHEELHPYDDSLSNQELALTLFEDRLLDGLRDDEIVILRRIVLDLVTKNYVKALECLAYSYYGGNQIFDCDWNKARDCFLLLMEHQDVSEQRIPIYANTLGYIYYYGRCNDGIPEYEKAFYYYSIGASGGIYESIYKLSDMYLHGSGVPKNSYLAKHLIKMIYDECLEHFTTEHFDGPFADVALRMGNLCRDHILPYDEYYYYTLAHYAICKRENYRQYGDSRVYDGIQKELSRIRKTRPLLKEHQIRTNYLPAVAYHLMEGHTCEIQLTPNPEGASLRIKRVTNPEEPRHKVFDCLPNYGYCELVEEAMLQLMGDFSDVLSEPEVMLVDHFLMDYYDDYTEITFMHHDKTCITLDVEQFIQNLPYEIERGEAIPFVSVSFTPNGKRYDYICEIKDIKVGDYVIVLANGEEKEVKVYDVFEMDVNDLPLPLKRYQKVLRKA